MSRVIFSVPQSGTRFVHNFFMHCGVYMGIHHTNEEKPPLARSVIPLRHPYDVYDSWAARGWLRTVPYFLEQWRLIRDRPKLVKCFYFPIAADLDNRVTLMRNAAAFIGTTYPGGFLWKPAGMNPKRDHSKHPYMEVVDRLAELVNWYVETVIDSTSEAE